MKMFIQKTLSLYLALLAHLHVFKYVQVEEMLEAGLWISLACFHFFKNSSCFPLKVLCSWLTQYLPFHWCFTNTCLFCH